MSTARLEMTLIPSSDYGEDDTRDIASRTRVINANDDLGSTSLRVEIARGLTRATAIALLEQVIVTLQTDTAVATTNDWFADNSQRDTQRGVESKS